MWASTSVSIEKSSGTRLILKRNKYYVIMLFGETRLVLRNMKFALNFLGTFGGGAKNVPLLELELSPSLPPSLLPSLPLSLSPSYPLSAPRINKVRSEPLGGRERVVGSNMKAYQVGLW